jgi:hypothetical protein
MSNEVKVVSVRALDDMDAGELRERLVRRAVRIKENDPTICCWSDLLPHVQDDISRISMKIGKSTAFVFACTIDDIEAGNYDLSGS